MSSSGRASLSVAACWIFSTMSRPSVTSPNTVYCPSRCGVPLRLVDLDHLGCQLHRTLGDGVETLLHLRQDAVIGIHLAPDDIELAGRGATLGVLLVAFAGHGHGSPTVEYLRQTELRLLGVVEVARAESLSGFGMLAVGVAALDHEVLDDAVEEQRVVDAHLRQFQEVVAVLRRLVIEADADVACRGLEEHLGGLGLRLQVA